MERQNRDAVREASKKVRYTIYSDDEAAECMFARRDLEKYVWNPSRDPSCRLCSERWEYDTMLKVTCWLSNTRIVSFGY